MPREISFSVLGEPVTQGSMRALHDKTGRAYVTHQSGAKLKNWRQAVALTAMSKRKGGLLDGPIEIEMSFGLKKPKKPGDDEYPIAFGRHDVDKFTRAVFDALSGVIWTDDSQVVKVTASKRWAKPGAEGVSVVVRSCR